MQRVCVCERERSPAAAACVVCDVTWLMSHDSCHVTHVTRLTLSSLSCVCVCVQHLCISVCMWMCVSGGGWSNVDDRVTWLISTHMSHVSVDVPHMCRYESYTYECDMTHIYTHHVTWLISTHMSVTWLISTHVIELWFEPGDMTHVYTYDVSRYESCHTHMCMTHIYTYESCECRCASYV